MKSTIDADKRLRSLFAFSAFGIPLGLSILTASSEPYWLDSPEFTAAVQTLGIPHPPGHPLYVMLTKPFTLLPFGSIAFRVSLASAVFGALASFVLYHLIRHLIDIASPSVASWIRGTVALSSVLIASLAPGWWFQCVRQEVYSLQILLVLGFVCPLVIAALTPGPASNRHFYLAAFCAGLGISNHHYITIVALPLAIPLLVAEARYRGGLATCVFGIRLGLVGLTGLLPYLFLPIRSMGGALISLGGVHSVGDFFWVLSAKVYQKSMLREHAMDLSTRSVDALLSMMGQIHPIVLVLSVAGLYFMIRIGRTRITGVMLGLLCGVAILLRAVMGFDPFNPDYYGYMLPVLAGFVTGFGFFIAVSMEIINAHLRSGKIVASIMAAGMVLVPVVQARTAQEEADLSRFRATRLLLDSAFEDAEEGALVLTSYYKLFFVLSAARFVSGFRPDIHVVNPKLFGYPGYLRATLKANPKLRKLARTMVVHGNLTESTAADLAWKGPLYLEPDLWIPNEVTRYMLPAGPLYPTSAEPLAGQDVRAAAKTHFDKWTDFYHRLGPHWHEHETLRMLSWSHYQDALFFARRGQRDGALRAIEMYSALGTLAPELIALKRELLSENRGLIDIAPFMPGQQSEPSQ